MADDIERARSLARVLDTAVGIPGTRLRIGLDAILGLVPGAGDAIGTILSGYIVLAAARAGVSRPIIMRMIGNVVLDTVVGSVPLLGDIFDVAFRANARNFALLERFAAQPAAAEKSSRRLGVVIVIVLGLVVLGLATLGFLLARALWNLVTA